MANDNYSTDLAQAYIALSQANQRIADLLVTQPGNTAAVRNYRAEALKAMQAAEQCALVANIKL